MSLHRIRLPAPWRAAGSAEPTGASVIFSRSFQRPTGLTAQSALALEVTLHEPLSITVALNGHACPAMQRSELVFEAPLRIDQLQRVNQLEVSVQLPADAIAMEQPKFGQDYLSKVELVLR